MYPDDRPCFIARSAVLKKKGRPSDVVSSFESELEGERKEVPLAALDENLRSLFFMIRYLEKEGKEMGEETNQSKRKKRKVEEVLDDEHIFQDQDPLGQLVLQPQFEVVFALCAKVFLTLAYTGEAVVNCKLFKSYSLLRSELQCLMLKVHEQFKLDLAGSESLASAFGTTSVSDSGSKTTSRAVGRSAKTKLDKEARLASMNALELAELLCSTFIDKAASSVAIEEEDEEAAHERITLIVKSKVKEIVDPLKTYVSSIMVLPLVLQDAPRKCLGDLRLSAEQGASNKDLTDVISIAKVRIDEAIPFAWVMFASDVAEIFADRGHWPIGTEEARFSQIKNSKTLGTFNLYIILSRG